MTTKLNLVNDQIVALSVTTTESLVANTISGDGTRVSNVDAVSLNGQTPAYYLNYNNFTNTPDLTVYTTKTDSVASNNAIKGLIDTKMAVSNVAAIQSTLQSNIDTKLAVSNATATFAPINNATMTGTTQFANLSDGSITITAFVDEDNMSSDSATLVPTQQSVKAYVDTEIAGISSSFTLSADSGSDDTFTTGGTLTFAGTANEIETTVTNDQIQIGLPDNVTIGNNLTVTGALNSDDITAAQVTVGGNAVITGNLTVQGTTTTVDSTTVQIADSVFRVNSDGSVVSAGLEAIIGANTESILFNPTTQRWEFSDDVHTAGSVTFGSLSDGTISGVTFVDEDNMASDSATRIPTQQSVKAYVDSQVSGSGGTLQPQIDDRMQVANVNTIQTNLENSIGTKMAVANVNTIKTNLEASIDTKLAVANATLQNITTTGSTTTDTITAGGFTTTNTLTTGNVVVSDTITMAGGSGGTITGAATMSANTMTALDTLTVGNYSVTGIVDTDTMSNASNTTLATSESVKAYVDSQSSGTLLPLINDRMQVANVNTIKTNLENSIDTKMAVANVNTIKTNLEASIDTKMAVANVNTIKTNLENSIDTKLAVANATLQKITSTGATTTAIVTTGGLTSNGNVTAANVTVTDTLIMSGGTGGTITGASSITANTLSATQNLAVGGYTVSGINDDDTMANASNTTLATSESVKAYVDTQLTAQDVDFAGDSGTGAVDLDSQSLTIAGGTGLTSTASGQTLTVALDNTAVTPGSYGSTTAVPVVTVDQQGRLTSVSTATIATSFDVAADSGSTDTVAGGETLTFAGTTNEIETSVTNNRITVGLPDDVTIGNNLTVTGALNSDDITAAQVTVGGNAVITGNLTVQGTTTTVNSTEVTIADSVFRVNSDGAVVSAGLEAIIGSNTESILFNPTTQRWEFSDDIHTAGNLSVADVTFANLNDGSTTIAGFVDEDNMSSDSATLLPTQQSVKAYVDSQVSGSGGTLQPQIDDRMQVANVNTIQTNLQANIDDRMQVANVNTLVTNTQNTLQANIDTKLAVSNATATFAPINNATLTGTTQFANLSDGSITVTAFVDEDNMASDSATLVPTQQSVKAYVDTEISGANSTQTALIEDRMQVANVNAIQTSLQSNIDTKLAVSNATATFAPIDGATLTGTTQFANLSDGTITITAFVDEDNMASDSATLVPTQQSVKAYVDSEITGANASLQADIDDRMQVANVNTIKTNLENSIGTKMAVANVNTIKTNLENSIDTKLAVANATLQNVTSTGSTTTATITAGGFTTTNTLTAGNVVVNDTLTMASGTGGTISGASSVTANTLTASQNLTVGGYTVSGVNDDDTMANASNTTLATSESVKAYVDTQITAQDVDFAGDSGTGAVDLDSQSLTIAGGTGLTSTASGQTLTVALDNTAVTPGSYGSTTAVPVVTVDQQGRLTSVSTATIATSFDIAADSGSTDTVAGGETLTFEGTANEIETAVTNNKITVGLPDNVTIGNNLTVTGALNSDDITAAQVSVNGNAVITGNLTVQGTTTTVNSTEVTIADSVFRVNSDGSVVSAGLEAIIGANTESILFNPSTQRWEFSGDLHTAGNLSVADVTFANLNDGTTTIAGFVDEDNMSSDSATLVPTQQSVKAYVDSQVSSSGGTLQPQIDDRMQVANVNTIQTNLQNSISTKMAVANVNTIKTNLESSISTKLAVSNAIATFAPINNATMTGTTQFANLSDGTITVTAFVDEDNMASNSATLVPTQQSVKAYVDTEVSGANASLQANIDDRMQVANVNTIKTTLENSIGTKLAVANATLQNITSTGATTTDSITVGGLTAASIAYPGSDGSAGQAIVTDGSGNLSFDTVARDPVPTLGTFNSVKLKAITPNGNTAYALQYANGATYSVNNQNSLLVSLNGIIQEPGSSFTTGGTGNSTITFSSALTAQDQLNFIVDMAPTGTFTITNETLAVKNINANTITIDGTSVNTMINNKFDDVVDNAPSTLNTLNELAAAMGDDQFFANTVTNTIATKLATADFNSTLDARLSSGSMSANITTTGNMTAANFNTTSDQRLKSNIADAAPSSAIVDAIQVRQYDWNDSGKHEDYGFVAQELHEVYPAAVTPGESEAEIWTVDFSKLVPLLVKEVQDLKARIAELEG